MKIATNKLMEFAAPQAGIVNARQYPGKTRPSTAPENSNSITTQHFNYHIAAHPFKIRTKRLQKNSLRPGHQSAPHISMTGCKIDISTEGATIP